MQWSFSLALFFFFYFGTIVMKIETDLKIETMHNNKKNSYPFDKHYIGRKTEYVDIMKV